ncbi:NUDIX hydrolase [Microbacterium halimionae]|uniref:NUDIX hydrolase n=1 Tax=Microbacterium halimionae TaxID=1526413 RepID=UPI001421F205|nr:CoA pyrophosphatase [Microbacterium halimionae]
MATKGARDQLRALADAAANGERMFPVFDQMPRARRERAASVLILFGALDTFPSAHDADAHAVSRDLDVLLLARASTLRSHPGQVAFPGGRADPGDADAIAAALREAREETGLDTEGVEVLGTLEGVPLSFSEHLVTPVLAWWRRPSPVGVVDECESSDVFRAPVADLLDPANRGVTVLERGGQQWRGPAFHAKGQHGTQLVWGFTALLLDALFDRLGWTEPWDETREFTIGGG